jgi:hypothetical protein
MPLCDEYVCIVDDPAEGLEGYEYLTTASTEEEAGINAQVEFPSGIIRAVHQKSYIDWADALGERARKMQAAETPSNDPLGEIIEHLSEVKKLH